MINHETAAKIATAKVIDDKLYKSLSLELPQNTTLVVDTTIRIAGAIKKGAAYRQRVAAAANPWALLAKALSKLNSATIESIVEESMSVGDEEASAIKAKASEALDKILASTERDMPGRVTATLTWELAS